MCTELLVPGCHHTVYKFMALALHVTLRLLDSGSIIVMSNQRTVIIQHFDLLWLVDESHSASE